MDITPRTWAVNYWQGPPLTTQAYYTVNLGQQKPSDERLRAPTGLTPSLRPTSSSWTSPVCPGSCSPTRTLPLELSRKIWLCSTALTLLWSTRWNSSGKSVTDCDNLGTAVIHTLDLFREIWYYWLWQHGRSCDPHAGTLPGNLILLTVFYNMDVASIYTLEHCRKICCDKCCTAWTLLWSTRWKVHENSLIREHVLQHGHCFDQRAGQLHRKDVCA